jgi:hypothetical protein
MSNLCINWRFGTWFFQVERDFPFRVRVNNSEWWREKYREGPQPFFGFYNTFGWRAE